MTVLTKASDMVRKPDLMSTPLVVENRFDAERCVTPPRVPERACVIVYRSHCRLFKLCCTLFTTVLLLAGAVLGLVYYSERQDAPRYKGYCAIPIEMPRDIRYQKKAALDSAHMPLHWSSEPEVSVYSTEDEQTTGEALNLLELFDIVSENYMKVSVYDHGTGHKVDFIHDFNANATGIVDNKRCFIMELDGAAVLAPGALVARIGRGALFDVAPARRRLRALLPPRAPAGLADLGFAEKCVDRPTYDLHSAVDIIRKRSLEEPAKDYQYFAGKRLQELTIENLEDLLAYEKKLSS